jgi:hypothetical protein
MDCFSYARLAEKHDIEISYRLIPLVDDLTHILKKLARTNYTNAATRRILHHLGIVVRTEGQAASPGDQSTVPEMWLSACVGIGFRETLFSPICLAGFLFDLSCLDEV